MANEKKFQLKTINESVVLEEVLSRSISGDTVRVILTYGLGFDLGLCQPFIQTGSTLIDIESYAESLGKSIFDVLRSLRQEGTYLKYNPTQVFYIAEHTLVVRGGSVQSEGLSLFIPTSLDDKGRYTCKDVTFEFNTLVRRGIATQNQEFVKTRI